LKIYFKIQESASKASLRGLSAVREKIASASGTNGTCLKTVDGGKNWFSVKMERTDSLDFRDVEAFSADLVYLMSAGPGSASRIYKSSDGGKNWQLQVANQHASGFFDGMAFWDSENGIVYSDPVDGKHLLFTTSNGGKNWNRVPPEQLPIMKEGEYGFAASGTGIRVSGKNQLWIASGGNCSRIFISKDRGKNWQVRETPLISGFASTGIFGITFRNEKNGVAVGGDYQKPLNSKGTVATTIDGGLTWQDRSGKDTVTFRSAVSYIPETTPFALLAIGSDGVSSSFNDGRTWNSSDSIGFHVISFGPTQNSGWVAGSSGRIAKIEIK